MNPTTRPAPDQTVRDRDADARAEAWLDTPAATANPARIEPGSFTDRAGNWLQRTGLVGSWLRTGAWVTAVLVVAYALARWVVPLP